MNPVHGFEEQESWDDRNAYGRVFDLQKTDRGTIGGVAQSEKVLAIWLYSVSNQLGL